MNINFPLLMQDSAWQAEVKWFIRRPRRSGAGPEWASLHPMRR
ncbi:hypothetical protein CBM2586_B90426 [Cupriavidus phytorum]|uniref:Uncharacterized protein n=1 Tax=Cupriavidus taiwanensis TaxID=164546 RepID=A0A375CNX4_9BURK|nr:hypothetical protein CBM2586_B90426 [Cupriavidus taiwanensis]